MRLTPDLDIKSGIILILLGCVSVVLYRAGLTASGVSGIRFFMKVAFIQSAIYLVAAWIVIRARSSNSTLLIAIAFAIVFRLSILFAPPYFSDDIYRYVWDGRVQAAGINPYRYIPAAPELAQLRDDTIYPKINRRDYAHTIYPPVAQVVFLLTTRISESVVWMKVTMLIFEMVAIWAIASLLNLLGRPRQLLLLYAWHPLVVWEFAGSGHVDAIAIGFIALAFLAWQKRSDLGAGFLLACATLVKLFPARSPARDAQARALENRAGLCGDNHRGLSGLSQCWTNGRLRFCACIHAGNGSNHRSTVLRVESGPQTVRSGIASLVYMIATVFVMSGLALWVLLED